MEHRFRIEITAVRKVKAPLYGPEAYYFDYKREDFPFGKGKPYKNRAHAQSVAQARAKQLQDESTRVELTHWRGYCGRISELFKSERLFARAWSELKLH